jgi:DMSO/TMAO reductase YedYZ molybdopterin-dependent catalytic subunit
VQWGNGALGNARWTGVPLKALLDKSGVKAGAREVSFAGLDRAPWPSTPQFVKSISVDLARSDDVLVAYAMNDAPLPLLNGFPMRLVVPGYYSTYWVKALESIRVLDTEFDGYWVKKAYRIPNTKNAVEAPDALATETVPITKMNVRSLLVTP